MDKRVIIAVILSMGVLLLYPYALKKIYPPKPAQTQAVKEAEKQAPSAPTERAKDAKQLPAPVKEEFTTVDTPLFTAVFTNNGGAVRKWELKKYEQTLNKDGRHINLADTVSRGSLKTVLEVRGSSEPVLFTPSKTGIALKDGEKAELTFTGVKDGLRIEKRYTFSGDSYIFNTEVNVFNRSAKPVQGKVSTLMVASVAGKDTTGFHTGPIIKAKDKLIRLTEKESQKNGAEPPKWIGIEDKYFLSVLIPSKEPQLAWSGEVASSISSNASIGVPFDLAPGAKAGLSYNAFLGPKEYDLLLEQKIGLEEAIEFGMFALLAKPFLVVLNFFERYLGNYGLAILVLTVITKVIFYPLSKHSLNSMNEMKKIQPQLVAIKEKYKGNKEKMNKELMELYKRYKVNPVSGCLPMVLQIPVFIALYEVLYVAIELRHAPFFLWIKDLSDKDPYYITPLIMGATMFIQQKMTPTSVDPTQAKMMLIMPVVFTFMFLNFPSGLVIYWLVNNVLSIAQQYYIQRAPAKA